jgi:biopolymer transport protein TolQ
MMTHPLVEAYMRSDLFGRLIFLSLFALSILSGIVLVYKIWLTRFVNKLSDDVEKNFQLKKKTPLNLDYKNLVQKVGVPNPFSEVYKILKLNTLEILKKNKSSRGGQEGEYVPTYLSPTDIEQLGAGVSSVILNEKKKLERYLFVLSTVVSVSPLLGLLGTVWGISVSLSQLANQANVMTNEAVLSGLAMALGTTVLGIVVAIPALIAYNYLKHRVEDFSARMDEFSSEILSSIEMLYRAVDVHHG